MIPIFQVAEAICQNNPNSSEYNSQTSSQPLFIKRLHFNMIYVAAAMPKGRLCDGVLDFKNSETDLA